jgi:hypothetical protein
LFVLKLVELLLHQAQLLFQRGNFNVVVAGRLCMRLSRRSHNKEQRSVNDTIEPVHHCFPFQSEYTGRRSTNTTRTVNCMTVII